MTSNVIEDTVARYFNEFGAQILDSFGIATGQETLAIVNILPKQMSDSSGLVFSGDFLKSENQHTHCKILSPMKLSKMPF